MDRSWQRPEGALIDAALRAHPGLRSVSAAAAQAGVSRSRWAQIVSGYIGAGDGRSEVIAPAGTLAKMAAPLGITAEQLREAGRQDAAASLEVIAASRAERPDAGRRTRAQEAMLAALDANGVSDLGDQLEELGALVRSLAREVTVRRH